jgi:uncharacterized protein
MRHLSLATLALAAASCQGVPHPTACTDIDCSGHGTCTLAPTAKGEVPTCLCAAGYAPTVSGLLCTPVKDTSLCYGVDCSGRGTCASVHGQPSCVCDQGLAVGPDGRSCVDPCASVTCGGHGTCLVSSGAARCTCAAGYRLSTDGLSCAVTPTSFYVYSLLYDGHQLGRAVLDLGAPGEGKLTETISYSISFDTHGWRGLSRAARLGYTVDASGKEVTALQFDDETRMGNVTHRRRGELSWSGSKGTLSLQRAGKLATVSLTATGSKSPIPTFGGLDYPWMMSLGCPSPLFYVLVLGRYDAVAKGAQSLEVVWPDAGQTGSVKVEADPSWTAARPVLRFPDWDIKVTYKDGLPQTISIEQKQGLSWSLGEGTPADLNLGDPPTPTPFTPAALPADLLESALSFPSADATAISGTLAVPTGKAGPFPAVLFVSDAMAATRDAPYFLLPGAPLYRDLAAHLAHAGYASLRFDPRGRGSSKGDASKVTMALMLQDATAAYSALMAVPNIDKTRIYLVSLGVSSITALSLVASKTVKGYVALALVVKDLAKVITFHDTSVFKAAGFSTEFLTETEKETDQALQEITGGTYAGSDWRGLPVALWKEWLAFDGSATLGDFAGPVLAVRGDQDLEIPAEQLQAATDAATKTGKKNLTATTLPGLAYNLTEGASADLWERALLPIEVPSLALSTILTWLGQN